MDLKGMNIFPSESKKTIDLLERDRRLNVWKIKKLRLFQKLQWKKRDNFKTTTHAKYCHVTTGKGL